MVLLLQNRPTLLLNSLPGTTQATRLVSTSICLNYPYSSLSLSLPHSSLHSSGTGVPLHLLQLAPLTLVVPLKAPHLSLTTQPHHNNDSLTRSRPPRLRCRTRPMPLNSTIPPHSPHRDNFTGPPLAPEGAMPPAITHHFPLPNDSSQSMGISQAK